MLTDFDRNEHSFDYQILSIFRTVSSAEDTMLI